MKQPGAAVDETGRGTSRERVAAQLRAEILSGRLVPGARLRTEAVMERFGVSNSPAREAFAQLAAEGLIEVSRNRGAAVATLSHDTAVDLVRANALLWAGALGWIVPALRRRAVDDLRRTDVDFSLGLRSGDLSGAVLDAERFQRLLLDACPSPELTRMITAARPRVLRVVRMVVTLPVLATIGELHTAVLASAGTEDTQAAVAATARVGDELVAAIGRAPAAFERTSDR